MNAPSLRKLLETAVDKSCFINLEDFFNFSGEYLKFIETGLQAKIISQNESNYTFFQYKEDGHFNISRPVNSLLLLTAEEYAKAIPKIKIILKNHNDLQEAGTAGKEALRKTIYTVQQTIGACLDALPAGKSNQARKLSGDYFELFIRLIINYMGFECSSEWTEIPVMENQNILFKMKYQHDLLIRKNKEIKIIGSVKTSSKDRLDKIFIDKLFYSKITGTKVPHIAIFLNDVQRKKTKIKSKYNVNSTFLPGRFKGYTIKLNPLDGVYYCDIRPNMVEEEFLRKNIKTIDCFFCEDIWLFTK